MILFRISKPNDPNGGRYQRHGLIGDTANREHDDIVYQHHRRRQQNALSQPLHVAEDNEKRVDDKPENAEQGIETLKSERSAHTHYHTENSKPYVNVTLALHKEKANEISYKTYGVQHTSNRRAKQKIADAGGKRGQAQCKKHLLFRI